MDLLCFSHLRWDFVFQRPQHLLVRAARTRRVFYFEEPEWVEHGDVVLRTRTQDGVTVVRPVLPWRTDPGWAQRILLDRLVEAYAIQNPLLWYYTPHALPFSCHLPAHGIVYDCMDELSAFAGADPALPALERTLMARAGVVFTGGHSLYAAKRALHPNVHAFPSGVDAAHFRPARTGLPEPDSQRGIPHPRAGFYGVIDERMDLPLLHAVAQRLPGVQFVMVGPLAKLDPASLPAAANIHWAGPAAYAALPAHAAQWGAALMPFALNAATRFISPTKTPEYLAAGRPVVSTRVADVVTAWEHAPCVIVASGPDDFAQGVRRALDMGCAWWLDVDPALDAMSWDAVWSRMEALLPG